MNNKKLSYDDLINMLPIAYAHHKMIFDEMGDPCDYEFIEANKAFEQMTSLKVPDIIGKKVSQVLPGITDSKFNWIKRYGEIVLKNLRIKFDAYSEPLGKWYRVFAYSPQKDCFTTLFFDITDIVKKSEEQEIIYKMLNDIIFEMDENYYFSNILCADESILFIPKEETIGKNIQELFPKNLVTSFMKAMEKAKCSGEKVSVSYHSIKPNEDKWFEANIKFACINDKLKYIISISDITEKKQLEKKLQESEVLFRTIFEQAPIGIAILHNYNFLSNMNTMLEKILDRSKNELSSLSWVDITYPDDLKEELEKFEKLKSGEIDRYSMEKRFIKPDGSNTWVNVVITKLELEDKDNQNYLCIVQDINKRKHALETLKESERSKSVFLSHLPGLAYRCKYDKEQTVLFISNGCFKLTKYKPEDFTNNKDLLNTQIISPEYREIIWNEWQRVISLKKPFQYEYEIITALGERKWVWEIGQGIYDEKGNVEALEGIVIDITESKKRLFQIQFMSDHDFMTGLYNRKYFEESKKKMDKEDCLPLSIIIADINGLRLINDAFGYSEGDWVITKTGKIIQNCCRKEDILARIGGDEFNILLPNTNSKKAYEIIHKIKNACEQYNLSIKNKAQSINLSMGYGTKQTKEESIQIAEKEAEEYMNKRKLLESKSYHHMILASIMATMYVRSHETENHAKRLAHMSKLIGEKINLSQRNLDDLQLLAMLHDIGKVGIDDKILNKPGKLTDEEWVIMKKHSEFGYRIATSSQEFAHIAKYILSHHEHWDGTGYPSGLIKEEIPLLSRIIAVVDAYDAMTKKRVYRKALTKKAAIEEITKNAGTQFDPEIVKVFIEIIK